MGNQTMVFQSCEQVDFVERHRKVLGRVVITIALVMTAWMAYFAHVETKEIREEQEQNSAILDSDIYPCAIMDAHGKIIRWNSAIADLTGYSKKEMVATGMGNIICDSDLLHKHQDGVARSFLDRENYGKLIL